MRSPLIRLGCLLSLMLGVALVLSVARPARAAGIYWAKLDSGTIGHANLNGSSVEQNFITGGSNPSYVAVDQSYIFWGNYWNDGSISIARANFDGSGVNQKFISFALGLY